MPGSCYDIDTCMLAYKYLRFFTENEAVLKIVSEMKNTVKRVSNSDGIKVNSEAQVIN